MKIIKLYHGTNAIFDDFEIGSEIGVHIGIKKAALSRMRAIYSPDLEIEEIVPSKADLDRYELQIKADKLNSDPQGYRHDQAKKQGFNPNKTFYHGTALSAFCKCVDIHIFDKNKVGDRFNSDRDGFFFSNNYYDADYYSSDENSFREPGSSNGVIYPVHLKTINPMVVDDKFLKKNNLPDFSEEGTISIWDSYQKEILEHYYLSDYDSIIIRDETDPKRGPVEMVVVFEPEQIRSVNSYFHPDYADTPYLQEMSDPEFQRVALLDEALLSILPKVSISPEELKKRLSGVSNDELLSAIDDYSNKKVLVSHTSSIERARMGNVFAVKSDGDVISYSETKSGAQKLLSELKASMLKTVSFSYENPLEMKDLGTWTSELIAQELSLSSSVIDRLEAFNSVEEKFELIRNYIFDMGHDCIVYNNEVESPGSVSYIALKVENLKIEKDFQNEYVFDM